MIPRSVLLALVSLCCAPAVAAAERRIDLIPNFGVRGGATLDADQPALAPAEAPASLSLGLGADVYLRPDAWFEAFVDTQELTFDADPGVFGASEFDMRVSYLQLGGGYQPGEGTFRPFVSAALGLTHYGADVGSVDDSIGFSGSIGGGFKAAMGRSLAFKLEVLGYGTINDAALAVACGPGCVVRFSAGGWYQLQARAGLAIRL
jgi:hypothetical protein